MDQKICCLVIVCGIALISTIPVAQKEKELLPNCHSILTRSLPECQAKLYGAPGEVWGEITVDVSSPLLYITEPDQRKKKRKNKNKKKQKKNEWHIRKISI